MQNNLALNETYFSFCCTLLLQPAVWVLRNSLNEMGFVYRASLERETGIRFSFNVLVKKADVIKYVLQCGLIVCCLFISLLVLSNSFAFRKNPVLKIYHERMLKF